MGNEISIRKADPAITPTTQQTGKTNVNVTNESGGVVNFNSYITYPQNTPGVSAEQLMAVQSFSKEYYQLIVTCEDDVFKDNIVTVPTNRALTKYNVPPEIFERCSTLSDEGTLLSRYLSSRITPIFTERLPTVTFQSMSMCHSI